MENKQIEETKNNARIYIGATVEKLRMDGCELWEIDGIVENILNYITVSEDSIVLTKAEKEKLLHEMYKQGVEEFADFIKSQMGIDRDYMGIKYKQGIFSDLDIDEFVKQFNNRGEENNK